METELQKLDSNAYFVATGERVERETSKNSKKKVVLGEHAPELDSVYESLEQVRSRFPASGISVERASASSGLSSAKVEELLARDGFNELTPPEQISEWVLLLKQVESL